MRPGRKRLARAIAFLLIVAGSAERAAATTYYVRQTVGDDTHEGTSSATAWQHIGKLSAALHAGDTAYVAPGLYREEIVLQNEGTPTARIILVADTTGQHTGDPPGTVMIAGADPVDATIFGPDSAPGVYTARFASRIWGAVEMDGPQFRYAGAREAKEHLADGLPEIEVVRKKPSTYFYDEATRVLYLHTSDGRPPSAHEIELIVRGSGIFAGGRHWVTVTGFTFRHMQDAGISFFKGSGDSIAIDNVAWGCRQGIRVYAAPNVLVYHNTLFRNDNAGVYFAAGSANGEAIGNTAYENVKGVRWSSQSTGGVCLDNVLFDNAERGIAIEEADRAILRRNTVANNAASQLLLIQSEYTAEDDCFETGVPTQLIAEFFPYRQADRYRTLAEYQKARMQDTHSREGRCGPLPVKVDVRAVHAATLAYRERARRLLAGESEAPAPGSSGLRDWLGKLIGR